ncbi:hypothetical protein ACCS33_22760 [Rhizobium ruizarguesonis]
MMLSVSMGRNNPKHYSWLQCLPTLAKLKFIEVVDDKENFQPIVLFLALRYHDLTAAPAVFSRPGNPADRLRRQDRNYIIFWKAMRGEPAMPCAHRHAALVRGESPREPHIPGAGQI